MFLEKSVISRRRNGTFLSQGLWETSGRAVWCSPQTLLQSCPAKKNCILPVRELSFSGKTKNAGAGLVPKVHFSLRF